MFKRGCIWVLNVSIFLQILLNKIKYMEVQIRHVHVVKCTTEFVFCARKHFQFLHQRKSRRREIFGPVALISKMIYEVRICCKALEKTGFSVFSVTLPQNMARHGKPYQLYHYMFCPDFISHRLMWETQSAVRTFVFVRSQLEGRKEKYHACTPVLN